MTISSSIYECVDECTCTKRKAQAAARYRAGSGFVYYQHIHKAGGSTLCSILARSRNVRLGRNVNCNLLMEAIPGNKSSEVQMRALPRTWTLADIERLMESSGRNALAAEDQPFSTMWGLSDSIMRGDVDNSRWSFITIVRHPVERLLSHFKFEQLAAKTGKNITEWAHWSPFQGQNYMVRMFAGMVPPKLPEHYLNQMDAIWPYFDHSPPVGWDAASMPPATHQDLERAKKVLQRFTVVLSLDWLEECAPLLKRWLNIEVDDVRARYWWGSIQATPAKRRHPPSPNGEHRDLFALNALDMELYEYARSLCRCNANKVYFRDHDEEKYEESSCIRAHKAPRPEALEREKRMC